VAWYTVWQNPAHQLEGHPLILMTAVATHLVMSFAQTLMIAISGHRVSRTNPNRFASSRVRYSLRAVRSVLSDERKLSIAALSQISPDRLIRSRRDLPRGSGTASGLS
jgi:hypothetical protein